ncbi:MAG: hypothetical protein ACLFP4_15495, partial [Spirochaetales bacterium]
MRNPRTMITKLALTAMIAMILLSGCVWLVEVFLERESDVTLSLTWEGDEDLDLYLTYPAPADGDTTDDFGTPP